MKIGEVRKGIPMPTGGGRFNLVRRNAGRLEIGQSFSIEQEEGEAVIRPTAVTTALNRVGKQSGKRFTCRKEAEGRLRVWRTA